MALLSSNSKKNDAQPPATGTAPPPSGATGGTRVRFDGITKLEEGNGGWRINANLTASYSGSDSPLPMYCRATPTKVIELDFIA